VFAFGLPSQVDLSAGWYIVTSFLTVLFVYVTLGMAVTVFKDGQWAYPNTAMWLALRGYILDGAAVVWRMDWGAAKQGRAAFTGCGSYHLAGSSDGSSGGGSGGGGVGGGGRDPPPELRRRAH
jgi:uncharacterized membrane protein YgcG